MLISPAYAQSGAGAGFDIMALAPLVLIFVVFYFLLIRPQQKKMKQHRDMLSAVRRGDRVVVGGIIGSVAKVFAASSRSSRRSGFSSTASRPSSATPWRAMSGRVGSPSRRP